MVNNKITKYPWQRNENFPVWDKLVQQCASELKKVAEKNSDYEPTGSDGLPSKIEERMALEVQEKVHYILNEKENSMSPTSWFLEI